MKLHIASALLVIASLLGGCAVTPPQQPISVAPEVLSAKATKVAVVMAPLPKVDTQFPGAGCLLCLAAASVTNSSLTSYVQTLPTEDLGQLPTEVTKLLRTRGFDATLVREPLDIRSLPDVAKVEQNFARKNFASLKSKYQVDKVLVIDIQAVGVWRNYANYFPAGAPTAVLRGTGYMVNLNTNALEWFASLDVTKPSDGAWDEAPKFPGLTNAYFQAIESGRDVFTKAFAQ